MIAYAIALKDRSFLAAWDEGRGDFHRCHGSARENLMRKAADGVAKAVNQGECP
jgi:hypothetical protein